MEQTDFSIVSDEEVLAEAKKLKSFSVTNAFLVGFLFGIIVYSVFNNSFGFLMLIPLYIIYRLVNDPKSKRLKEVETILKQRKLQ
jgi:hypothetical protein